MKYNYLLLALATVALFSCSRNEVEDPDAGGVHVTIHAYQEGALDTRTTLVDGGTQVYWEPSDEIKVFFRGSGSRFLSQNTANAQVTDFSGSLNVVVGINEGASGSNTLWGLYPYRADATSDGASVTTTLPAEQTGRAGSYAKNTNITLAQSNSFDLAFYNVTGGIRFSLTQEGVKEVIFEGQNNETIAGKVKIAFADGVPAIQEVVEGQTSITLSAPNGGTFETGKWYYIVALPGTLSNGFKMTFNTDTQYATLKSSGSKTIKRGIFGSLADADEGLIYKDKGGNGDEPHGDFIVFKDPVAKYACVEKYDSDGDGEISYEEAASVTSVEGLFKNWNTVSSFDEFKYFTSVTSMSSAFKNLSNLKSVTLPEGIHAIDDQAFYYCDSLDSLTFMSSITTIGSKAFYGCTRLATIVLDDQLKTLRDYAFYYSGLQSIVIPESVTSFGTNVFQSCSSLLEIELPNCLTQIPDYTFDGCSALKDCSMSPNTISIGQYAFRYCSSLESLSLPYGLQAIGDCAFYASGLKSIVIPDSVISLGGYVFKDCKALVSAVLPSSTLTVIPGGFFNGCTKILTVSIPENFKEIGEYAFRGCQFYDSDSNTSKFEVPSSITTISGWSFESVHDIIITSSELVNIGYYPFTIGARIFVPDNKVEIYKVRTNWSTYADYIFPLSDYSDSPVFEAVDLGLSVKWATFNVGQFWPGSGGLYYAWGETEEKEYYYEFNYFDSSYTKYNTEGKTVLDPEDDVAHIMWGGSWRMPTAEEWRELRSNCTWTWMTLGYGYGYKIQSKIPGYEDKWIFLGARGYYDGDKLQNYSSDPYGRYWSSSLVTSNSAYHIDIERYGVNRGSDVDKRYRGLLVRPVCD